MQLTKKFSRGIIERAFQNGGKCAPNMAHADFCTVSDGGFSGLFLAKIHIE